MINVYYWIFVENYVVGFIDSFFKCEVLMLLFLLGFLKELWNMINVIFISNVYLIVVCNKKNILFIGYDLNKFFLNLNMIFFIFGDLLVMLILIWENINLLWVVEFFLNLFI